MTAQQPWYLDGDDWTLVQSADEPQRNIYFETIFSQANGRLGLRAYDEEHNPARPSVREGYFNGLFAGLDDRATGICNVDYPWPAVQMVALPELFGCRVTLGGEVLNLDAGQVAGFRRELNLHDAVLTRRLRWTSPKGRSSELVFERFLSAAEASLGGQRVTVRPLNWSGPAELEFGFDVAGTETVFRCGDKTQPELPHKHFDAIRAGTDGPVAWVEVETNATEHRVAFASVLRGPGRHEAAAGAVSQAVTLELHEGDPATVERGFAAVSDRQCDRPGEVARQIAVRFAAGGYASALAASQEVWARRWDLADVVIEGCPRDQKVVRFSVFQLLQLLVPGGDPLSLPARGLSFNRYRGLYFWDTETFILPFYAFTQPGAAAELLRFRAETLDGARRLAGLFKPSRGALYPWMSDAEGLDHSLDERVRVLSHQNGDIAYAVDQYARASGDEQFLLDHGLAILVETARFWADQCVLEGGQWHTEGYVGPDEDIEQGGRDNGYTNLLAAQNLCAAADWAERLRARRQEAFAAVAAGLDLETLEVERWRQIGENMAIPELPDRPGVPLQDAFLLTKPPADVLGWKLRESKDKWLLPAGRKVGEYQLIKQADIVLAMFLLQDRFSREQVAAAYDVYEPMTQHVSSLSWNTHAIVAARIGRRDEAYAYFQKSAALDLDDVKAATADGLHAAALGGCWQAVVFGFAGLSPLAREAAFDPQLPPAWSAVAFSLRFGGQVHRVRITRQGEVTIAKS